MTVLFTILIIVVAVGIVVFVVNSMRSAAKGIERSATAASPVPRRPMPMVTEFHVKGATATTLFAVPLGDADAGQHLIELLCASAVEYVREKQREGLPLDDVRHIEVSAMRGEASELLCTVDLPDAGVLPERNEKVLVEPTHDPIAAVHEVVADTSVSSQTDSGTALEPVTHAVQLSGPTDAHLRAIGVDTATMDLDDLVLGLLRVSGYDVHVGRTGMSGLAGIKDGKAGVYGLTREGKTTTLVILSHEDGSHPELEDSVLAKFAVGIAQMNPDQAILVTDKYSPYSMYEREKRDRRCTYITRERLQAFVDSFGLR